MDWGAVDAVAGGLAALFVALSVVYLAIQVKSGTRATRSQTYYLATTALADQAATIGSNREVSRIVRIGYETPEALDEDERVQFGYIVISFLRRYENIFFQYESGLIDEDFWSGHRENLLWVYRRPGVQHVWEDRKHSFSGSFREYLDRSAQIELTTPSGRSL